MNFCSILFERNEETTKRETLEAPAFFVDLNIDQIIDSIVSNKKEYNLKPFFYTSLKDTNTILYRHEVMQDLENENLFEYIKSFAQKMCTMRGQLTQADKLYYKYQKESWFLAAVEIYCEAVTRLVLDLTFVDLKSRGFLAFREYMTDYVRSDSFVSLTAETKKLKTDLASVKYCMLIKGNCIKVRKYESEIDYSADVEETFKKFKQGAVKDYKIKFSDAVGMNHVEAAVLDLVAKLYPDIFSNLDNYYIKNPNYIDETIGVFDREIQFYIAYLEHVAIFKGKGLKFCYPQVSDTCKEVYDKGAFDLALAYKLITGG